MALAIFRHKPDQHTENVHAPGGYKMREIMLGLNDGLVAAFAVTSGVAAAFTNPKVVVMAGLAEMLGGAVSMGLAAYASARAHYEFYQSERQREHDEIRRWPEREREEVRGIYRSKGFSGALLEQIVSHITADAKRWRDVMMSEELGFGTDVTEPPSRSAIFVGGSYLVGAAVPLLPYLFIAPPLGILASAIATVAVLFVVGAGKTLLTARPWWRSGLESMGVGIAAALVTYGAGRLFAGR
jgi:VIT1/CCC1 family predicted Fe2+/Mn2+ transporter